MNNISIGTSLFEYLHNTATPSWTGKTQAWLQDQGKSRAQVQIQEDSICQQYFNEADVIEAEKKRKEKQAEKKRWEETAKSIDAQARRWMVRAEAERQAALRELQKTRRVQEEIREAREKVNPRRTEWRKGRDEPVHDGESQSETRKKRDNATKKLIAAWNKYELRWKAIYSSPWKELTFRTVPWPLMNTPSSPTTISTENISFFLLSDIHSQNKSRRERILEAMQRWHSDKFEPRILPRVVESDRRAVKEGADIVVRCLNDLLTGESAKV